jgi:hypothetical protein
MIPRIWLESSTVIRTSRVRAVEAFNANLAKEPDFCKMRQTVGIVRVCLVRRHIKRSFGMASINADCWQPHAAQGVIKPHRQRTGFEYDALGGRRPLPDKFGNDVGIRCALPAPDPFAFTADRHCRLFHRHVETDIFCHGCSPFDAWARRQVVSPYFHLIGEQPPSKAMIGSSITVARFIDL